ncbi:MAG: hypothetical protein WD276_02300 [Actinomycetota bacterium]
MGEDAVSIRARFERFPATVKGAFVVRGEDADPHQVGFKVGRIVRMAGKESREIAIREEVLELPPHQDVFLPFEFSIAELEPGWYDLECDVVIDGSPGTRSGGRSFSVSWPRGSVRRGTISVPSQIGIDGTSVSFEPLECSGDHIELRYKVDPPARVTLKLLADGEPLGQIESEFDEETGQGRIVAYPLMRMQSRLVIEAAKGGEARASLAVPLR